MNRFWDWKRKDDPVLDRMLAERLEALKRNRAEGIAQAEADKARREAEAAEQAARNRAFWERQEPQPLRQWPPRKLG